MFVYVRNATGSRNSDITNRHVGTAHRSVRCFARLSPTAAFIVLEEADGKDVEDDADVGADGALGGHEASGVPKDWALVQTRKFRELAAMRWCV